MSEAYIVDAVRTPIGKLGGALSTIRVDDLAAITLKEILKRNPTIDSAQIDEVFLGCANQAGEDNRNIARMSLLLAGIPSSVPGQTINRLCASGMDAVINAARAIWVGDGDLFIAGGVENMTRAPLVMSKAEKAFSGKINIYDSSLGWRFINPKMQEMYGTESMGETAENLAEKYKISREAQDEFAYNSQMKAAAAIKSGRFAKEIIPIEISQGKGESSLFENDEFVKPNTTKEILAALKPAFRKNGTVTAGNSSGLNDGACSLIIASEKAIKKFDLKPKAKIVANAVTGVEPRIMGIGPVDATSKILSKTKMKLDDFDVIEINEAFAAQMLAVLFELKIKPDDERLNPNGGAIALGHPLGMSGARLIQTAMIELNEKNKKYALCTLCVGVGQGVAVVLERI
ncbi:3-oxoadipyl-CoA thiolase [Melioribacteraceae bacterium 4301-Me]|uniref:3-oxoadipyl-CoA thiolase n=1 Tax=Pyranulibacter aquaticus TaxID=3163344 RepID=UPI0035970CC7